MWVQAEAQKHSPLPPPPSHSIQAQGGGFIGLLGKLSLNPLRSSDTTDPAHGEAEWTSGEATLVFQPEALCILPASWRVNPGAHRKSANPADSTNAPKYMLPATATRAEAGRPPSRGLGHTPQAMLVQGTRRQPGFFHYLMRVHSRPFIHVFTLLLCDLSRNVCNGIFP